MRDDRRFSGRKPVPVKEGEAYDVTIEAVGNKGDGIGRVQGFVIVVPGVNKGDQVKVKIKAVRGRVSFGEVIEGGSSTKAKPKEAGEEESVEKTGEESEAESEEGVTEETDSEESEEESEEAVEEEESEDK